MTAPASRPHSARAATVLIPTHDHGPLLQRALTSAQRQTVEDIEIFVVGDGAPDITRDIVATARSADPRVRYFDNVKGARNGERYRHVALAEATGRIVCYLSDDDIWCPSHVAGMCDLLDDADWANALPVFLVGDELVFLPIDISVASERERLIGGDNSVPLSGSAHTLDAYRRLPHGWHAAPTTVPSDLYMYQQFLINEWCRARSGFAFTVLAFPSPDRRDWTEAQRVAELDHWLPILTDPQCHEDLLAVHGRLAEAVSRRLADMTVTHRRAGIEWEAWHAHRNREAERLQATVDTLRVHAEQLRQVLDERERELVEQRFLRAELEARLRDPGLSG